MNQDKATQLFIQGDAKHVRTIAIIKALLDGATPLDIARQHGVTRRAVTEIRTKYVKAQ